MRIALFLHVLSAVIWVGGMFFAYMALRPAAVEVLEPPARLKLWVATFRRFFRWVWIAVGFILGSGFFMIGIIDAVALYIDFMLGIGIVMALIFAYVFFEPYGRLKRRVAEEDWKAAGDALSQIRAWVGVNLSLGLVNIAVAILGPIFS